MKRLLLMRHAKSDWSRGLLSDHDRPLAARGLRACRTLGRFCSAAKWTPDLVVTSSAVRARTTAETVAQLAGWRCEIEVSGDLYGCGVDQALAYFRNLSEAHSLVVAAGHEPTWSGLAERLVGGGCVTMVTGAIARIDLDCVSWTQLQPGTGCLGWLVTPKTLAAATAGSSND